MEVVVNIDQLVKNGGDVTVKVCRDDLESLYICQYQWRNATYFTLKSLRGDLEEGGDVKNGFRHVDEVTYYILREVDKAIKAASIPVSQ